MMQHASLYSEPKGRSRQEQQKPHPGPNSVLGPRVNHARGLTIRTNPHPREVPVQTVARMRTSTNAGAVLWDTRRQAPAPQQHMRPDWAAGQHGTWPVTGRAQGVWPRKIHRRAEDSRDGVLDRERAAGTKRGLAASTLGDCDEGVACSQWRTTTNITNPK